MAGSGELPVPRHARAERPLLEEPPGGGTEMGADAERPKADRQPNLGQGGDGRQRLQPVPVEIDDSFQVLVVEEERSDEPGGFEPVVANPSRLDLRWLAEEQVLLALPLVPVHENADCIESEVADVDAASDEPADEEADDCVRQQPFRNLRDLMRK